MTDIITDIEAAFARVATHIKNLFDNGAPHQQQHANDLQAVLDAAKAGGPVTVSADLAAYDAKIANLQSNVDALLTERDSLKEQLAAAEAELAALRGAAVDTVKENSALSLAAAPIGGRIASAEQAADPNTAQPA